MLPILKGERGETDQKSGYHTLFRKNLRKKSSQGISFSA
jgi:hypothetical protein